MKKFYLLPLTCAIAALSACSPAPIKQEIVVAPPVLAPAPAPVVLRKVEPESTAPHYRLNPRNYLTPLNVLLVEQIKESLTPKVVDAATGAVVSRLPLRIPGRPVIDPAITVPTAATITALGATQPTIPALTLGSTSTFNNANNPTTAIPAGAPDTGLTGSGTPPIAPLAQPEQQNTEQALLEIDPSLKLDQQALAALATTQNAVAQPAIANPVPATTATTSPDTTTPPSIDVNTTSSALVAVAATAVELPKIMIPVHDQQAIGGALSPAPSSDQLNVTQLDKDILLIEGKARHYPTYFTDRLERSKAEKKIREIIQRLDVIAVDPRASYEVLLRAMKSHVLARNMDAGPDSAFKSAVYFQRLLKMRPNDPETSFWYGFSLGEGGGFRESIPHLNNAVKAGYQEAYLSLAHSYLQMEDKTNALTLLNNYKIKFPTDATRTDQLISEIQAGKRYSIWQ